MLEIPAQILPLAPAAGLPALVPTPPVGAFDEDGLEAGPGDDRRGPNHRPAQAHPALPGPTVPPLPPRLAVLPLAVDTDSGRCASP